MQLRNKVDIVTVGRLSLNFTGFNRESSSIFGNQLHKLIQRLVPYSHAIPLSIEYLNTATLQPRKDNKSGRYITFSLYDHLTTDVIIQCSLQLFLTLNYPNICCRLVTGVLQLPQGAHLTFDETTLQTGSLSSKGVENTVLLKNLMESQTVPIP